MGLLAEIRRRFTRWYVKQGYEFGYDFSDSKILGEPPFQIPCGDIKAYWKCPRWVRPLLVLFSPSEYMARAIGDKIAQWFIEGMEEQEREMEAHNE